MASNKQASKFHHDFVHTGKSHFLTVFSEGIDVACYNGISSLPKQEDIDVYFSIRGQKVRVDKWKTVLAKNGNYFKTSRINGFDVLLDRLCDCIDRYEKEIFKYHFCDKYNHDEASYKADFFPLPRTDYTFCVCLGNDFFFKTKKGLPPQFSPVVRQADFNTDTGRYEFDNGICPDEYGYLPCQNADGLSFKEFIDIGATVRSGCEGIQLL